MTDALLITVLLLIVGMYTGPLVMWAYWAVEDRTKESKQ